MAKKQQEKGQKKWLRWLNSPIPHGKTKGGERLNWNVPDETFKANWGTLCWAGPSSWLLSCEQKSSLFHRKPLHPITAHTHGTRTSPPWILDWPRGSPPQKHNLHLDPELNTAAVPEHPSRASALTDLQWSTGKRENLLKNPPLSPCLSGPRTFWTGELSASSSGLSSRRWMSTVLQLINYNFIRVAQYSPRTQPSHWTGYNSREHSRVERENGGVVHQQKKMTSTFRCPLVTSPSAPAKKNCGKTGELNLKNLPHKQSCLHLFLCSPHAGGKQPPAVTLQGLRGWEAPSVTVHGYCSSRSRQSLRDKHCWQFNSFCL